MTYIKVNEGLLREALEKELVRTVGDPSFNNRFSGMLWPDVMKMVSKEVVERVLKTFRP